MCKFYRWILAAHPRAFRERFESEMLCVFDDALPSEGALHLMRDAILSLLRQRLFRRRPARNVFQPAAEGPNLFRSVLPESHPFPLKISRLVFGAAISFNLFVITCALIGRRHAQRRDTNSANGAGSFQIFRWSGIRGGNTLALRGRSEIFPFVLVSRAGAETDAGEIQSGSDSLLWVNVPFESPNGTELIYVRMTREQFARFKNAGTAAVELVSADGAGQVKM
jgi:hypothetical protein